MAGPARCPVLRTLPGRSLAVRRTQNSMNERKRRRKKRKKERKRERKKETNGRSTHCSVLPAQVPRGQSAARAPGPGCRASALSQCFAQPPVGCRRVRPRWAAAPPAPAPPPCLCMHPASRAPRGAAGSRPPLILPQRAKHHVSGLHTSTVLPRLSSRMYARPAEGPDVLMDVLPGHCLPALTGRDVLICVTHV